MPTTKELLAKLTAARKAQREADRPVLAARRKLANAVQKARASVHKANLLLADELRGQAIGFGGWRLQEREQYVAERIARYSQVLTDLQTFDLQHGIDAEYS